MSRTFRPVESTPLRASPSAHWGLQVMVTCQVGPQQTQTVANAPPWCRVLADGGGGGMGTLHFVLILAVT